MLTTSVIDFMESLDPLVGVLSPSPKSTFFQKSPFWNDFNRALSPIGGISTLNHQHNIYKDNNNEVVVELGLPGYSKEDLEVYENNGNLIIKSSEQFNQKINENNTNNRTYLSRTLRPTQFSYTLNLKDASKVKHCDYSNGVLKIVLMQKPKIPENAVNLLSNQKTLEGVEADENNVVDDWK